PPASMHVETVVFEAIVIAGARQRDERAPSIAREEHAGLLEELSDGGDVICGGLAGREISELPCRVVHPVAPAGICGVGVAPVRASPWEHVRSAEGAGPFMAADHEHFRTSGAVPGHENRRGGAGAVLRRHFRTIARQPDGTLVRRGPRARARVAGPPGATM